MADRPLLVDLLGPLGNLLPTGLNDGLVAVEERSPAGRAYAAGRCPRTLVFPPAEWEVDISQFFQVQAADGFQLLADG